MIIFSIVLICHCNKCYISSIQLVPYVRVGLDPNHNSKFRRKRTFKNPSRPLAPKMPSNGKRPIFLAPKVPSNRVRPIFLAPNMPSNRVKPIILSPKVPSNRIRRSQQDRLVQLSQKEEKNQNDNIKISKSGSRSCWTDSHIIMQQTQIWS